MPRPKLTSNFAHLQSHDDRPAALKMREDTGKSGSFRNFTREWNSDKLEAVLGRVDACRARLDRVPALLKRFRQSVLAAVRSGKGVGPEFVRGFLDLR